MKSYQAQKTSRVGNDPTIFIILPSRLCCDYLRHIVVVELVIAESHIHVQREVLSDQDDNV